MKLDSIKEGLGSFWDSVSEGWRHISQSAANALTQFKPTKDSQLPSSSDVDDPLYQPNRAWSILGGEVFEDDDRLIVRLEVPGMEKENLSLEVLDDALVVAGEKRFTRETSEGRWHVMQRAYGSFRRVVPLPAAVLADDAKASYRDGVLRVDLPKARPGRIKSKTIKVE